MPIAHKTRRLPELCHCPLPEVVAYGPWPMRAPLPAESLPALSSLPAASKKLYLDFNGRNVGSWFGGAFSGVVAQPFVYVDDADIITEIWRRVSEDYSPWNLDVTTVEPGTLTQNNTAIICVGGSYSDWYGSAAGGVAERNGYSGVLANSNVGFVFANDLSNVTKYVAEAASHEAGHLFGCRHQALYSGTSKVSDYNPGSGDWAPIMGTSYTPVRTTWHDGPSDVGYDQYQDDLAVISAKNFGLRTDDFGNNIGAADALSLTGGAFDVDGILSTSDDADVWEFSCEAGEIDATLSGAVVGANTNLILELRDSEGELVAISAPSDSYNAHIQETVAAGDYFLLAYSTEDYGEVGQYNLSGTVPTAPPVTSRRGAGFGRRWLGRR